MLHTSQGTVLSTLKTTLSLKKGQTQLNPDYDPQFLTLFPVRREGASLPSVKT